jgi:filamentous hemagglutinin
MNKQNYRIIFSKSRGQLMAVAETACSQGKAASGERAGTSAKAQSASRAASKSFCGLPSLVSQAAFASLLMLGAPILISSHSLHGSALAQAIADPSAPANQRPTVLVTPNGVPLVNIQTPSAAGVSRNTYSQFDVTQRGLVLNNSRTNTQTQLGGWVQGNPWLATGSARIILNEVNSNNPSQLRGYIEVGGQRAEVIIANPAGVNIDGGGFINASRATITTGTPQLSGGALEGYAVQRGTITINGQGLDASLTDYTGILARAVQVNAGIWAKDLQIVTGANQISANQSSVTAAPASAQGAAPSFALDVAQLGGMYAGQIRLIGTEAGVGVRNAGTLAASAGNVVIDNKGWLSNSGQITAQRLDVSATSLDNSNGKIVQVGAQRLDIQLGELNNGTGQIGYDPITAAPPPVASPTPSPAPSANPSASPTSGSGGSASGNSTTITPAPLPTGSIRISGATNNDRGLISALGDIDLAVSGQLSNAGRIDVINLYVTAAPQLINTQMIQARSATLDVGSINNSNGKIIVANDVMIKAQQLLNTQGLIQSGGQLEIRSDQFSGDGLISSTGGDVKLTVQQDLQTSTRIEAARDLSIQTTGNWAHTGSLHAGSNLQGKANNLSVSLGALAQADTALQLQAQGTLTNRGLIDSANTQLIATDIVNTGSGARIYGDIVAINASNSLVNREEAVAGITGAATIAARDRLDIGAKHLVNRERALIFSAGDLAIGGELNASGQASGRAQTLNNNSATIESLGHARIGVQQLRNTNEHLRTQLLSWGSPQSYSLYQHRPGDVVSSWDNSTRWQASQVSVTDCESYCLNSPHGTSDAFVHFAFTLTQQRTQVVESAPARIVTGGNLTLDFDSGLNDNSHIIAGGALDLRGRTLTQNAIQGQLIDTESGTATSFWRSRRSGRDTYGSAAVPWNPSPSPSPIVIDEAQARQFTQPNGSGTALAVRTAYEGADSGFGTKLLSSSLFAVSSNPASRYLIETDPRFANYRNWLSSDYLLGALGIDPVTSQKRLGDGFYEQKLIREQIASLTGQRFLGNYASDEAQYQALMSNALTFASAHQLRPGVALSPAQVAQLTSDIVWLVEREVTLPDGRTVRAFVPQVYVRVQPGDVSGSGALIAGRSIELQLDDQLINRGTIAGRQLVSIDAQNIQNLGGTIAAKVVSLKAEQDIVNRGGVIQASEALAAAAKRDILVESTTFSTQSADGRFQRSGIERIAGLYVTGADGQPGVLVAHAGRDIELRAAQLSNSSTGVTQLTAGRDVRLATVTQSQSEKLQFSSVDRLSQSASQEVGSQIQTQGDLRIQAGRDVNVRAAQIDSAQALSVQATRDIRVEAGQSAEQMDSFSSRTSRGALSKSTRTAAASENQTNTLSSSLGGQTITLDAGRDIQIKGSQVIGDSNVLLLADRDITITTQQNTQTSESFKSVKSSGIMSAGMGIMIGSQKQSDESKTQSTTNTGSTIGSIAGDVTIIAGNNAKVQGSSIVTPSIGGDITILAKDIQITDVQNTQSQQTESKTKSSGLTISLSSPVLSAAQTIQSTAKAVSQTKDAKSRAVALATAGVAAKNASDAIKAGQSVKDGNLADKAGGISLSVSLGSSKSQTNTSFNSSEAQGSTLAAGGNITLAATGAGKDSNLLIQGSQIKADGNVSLSADNQVNLIAGQNTASSSRTSKSSSASVGVSVNLGAQTGVSLNASVSKSKGNASGSDLSYTNTEVTAGNQLIISSGGDTNLIGANVAGKTVIADIGGNLNIQSLQDSSTFTSKDRTSGGGISIPIVGGGAPSVSVNAGRTNMSSEFLTVTRQSGIAAGDGGFDIVVQGNTNLVGAVITSTAKAAEDNKNSLITGSLTIQDLQNRAVYKATDTNIGLSYSGVQKDKDGNTVYDKDGKAVQSGYNGFNASPPVPLSASGKASSTTASGITTNAGGNAVIISDEAAQLAATGKDAATTVASINTKVTTGIDTTNALKPIFNEAEIRAGFAITGAFVKELGTFIENRAKDADTKKAEADKAETTAKDPNNGLSDAQRLQLLQQAGNLRTEAQTITDNWGAGGTYRQITNALAAAASGNVSATSGQFVQNMLVNYVQQQGASYIGKLVASGTVTEGSPAHAALHAMLGCAGAAASNQSCASGAGGAAAASLLTTLFSDTNPNETQAQKEAKRNLLTSLVTGIATATGGNAATANNAAIASVDNNWLATQQIVQMKKELSEAKGILEELKVTAKWAAISGKQDVLTTSGIGKGLAEAGWNDIKGVAEFISDPIKGLQGIKELVSSKEAQQQLGDQVFKELNAKIDRMSDALKVGGDQNAEQLGKDIGSLLWTAGSVLTGAGGLAKGGVALARVGVNVGVDGLQALSGLAKFDTLLAKGGLFGLDGKPLMDFRNLTNPQKAVIGDTLGSAKVEAIVPGAEKIGRVPTVGQTGIDDLYKVKKPDVDYIVVEYKYGSSKLGSTADGVQMSDTWLTGSNTGYNRILESVNGNTQVANSVDKAIQLGRVEKWVVHTDPFGVVTVGVVDKAGKIVPNPQAASTILRGLK